MLESNKMKHGFSEMILEHHMESRVMKNKLIQLVCIMDTIIGHPKLLGILITQQRKVFTYLFVHRLRRGFKVF